MARLLLASRQQSLLMRQFFAAELISAENYIDNYIITLQLKMNPGLVYKLVHNFE